MGFAVKAIGNDLTGFKQRIQGRPDG